jgi:hypothetical protein
MGPRTAAGGSPLRTVTAARGGWPPRFGSRRHPPRLGERPHWPSAASGGGWPGSGADRIGHPPPWWRTAYTRGRPPHSSSLSPSFNHIGCAAIAFGTYCSYVVEGGGPLCYYIYMVSLSTLRCSKLRPLLGPPPRIRMVVETEHDVVTGE